MIYDRKARNNDWKRAKHSDKTRSFFLSFGHIRSVPSVTSYLMMKRVKGMRHDGCTIPSVAERYAEERESCQKGSYR